MRYVAARLVSAFLVGAVLALAAGLALPKCEGSGPHPYVLTSTTRPAPNPQVVDGLYKSLVIVTPDNRTLICILTRLPLSLPHYTIPPEYSCVRAP